eukprot:8992022-Pyramimonas_sp.AAC.1
MEPPRATLGPSETLLKSREAKMLNMYIFMRNLMMFFSWGPLAGSSLEASGGTLGASWDGLGAFSVAPKRPRRNVGHN